MKIPQPAWACLLALMGAILVICIMFKPTPENIALGALGAANSLISGALGAFAGRAEGSATTQTGPNALTVNQVTPPAPPIPPELKP